MATFMTSLDRFVQTLLRALCIILFIALALILLTNVGVRLMNDLSVFLTAHGMASAGSMIKALVPITSMHWFDEIVELIITGMVFYGAAALWGTKGHFCVGDWISKRLPNNTLRALYKLLVTLLSVAFLLIFFWYSLSLTRRATELSTVFQIPKSVMYSCMPISAFIMLVYSAGDVIQDIKRFFAPAESGDGAPDYRNM